MNTPHTINDVVLKEIEYYGNNIRKNPQAMFANQSADKYVDSIITNNIPEHEREWYFEMYRLTKRERQ